MIWAGWASGGEHLGGGEQERAKGEIVPVWWATSSRNDGRFRPGIGRQTPSVAPGFLVWACSGAAVEKYRDRLPYQVLGG